MLLVLETKSLEILATDYPLKSAGMQICDRRMTRQGSLYMIPLLVFWTRGCESSYLTLGS